MGIALTKWQSLTQQPRVVQFFTGLLDRAGVRVTDTGEEFTCHHRGDRIEFEPTLDPSKVDYTVDILADQVDRLAAHAATGDLDETEQYRIVSTLFTPATAATLRSPVLGNRFLRRLAGAEEVIHVELVAPTPEQEPVRHTLIYANGQWLVFSGLHGRPGRKFRLTLADALEYQRRVFRAVKENRFTTWIKFSTWYRSWRKSVSTRG